MLFNHLQDHGLVIKREKCRFGVSEIDFLGHTVTHLGIKPLPTKVQAITQFPRPIEVKGLERFVGMFNFYHWCIANAAEILQPLY